MFIPDDTKGRTNNDEKNTTYSIAVIGGGIAGVMSALECAKEGHKIYLFEKNTDILLGTSKNQCYRLHTGLHYPDPTYKTSIKCLQGTISSLKKLPQDCINIQKSRYYLMSNSPFSKEEMRNTAEVIVAAYKQLIEDCPANKLLGEPNELIQEISYAEYSYVSQNIPFTKENGEIEEIFPILVMDIIEPQIRIDKLRTYLRQQISETNNMTLLTGTEVLNISKNSNDFGYQLDVVVWEKRAKSKYKCDGIVNCSWEEIEKLNPEDYNKYCDNNIRNRMKIMVHVELPKLEKGEKAIPTSLFCYGPHCAVSVLEDGTGIMTWEPKTNTSSWLVSKEQPKKIAAIMTKKCEKERYLQKVGEDIVNGFGKYIPKFKNSKILDVRIGYVRTPVKKEENFSIYTRNSSIHYRQGCGVSSIVEVFGSCYIVNEARKFTYGIQNAAIVRSRMKEELHRVHPWKNIYKNMISGNQIQDFKDFWRVLNTINFMCYDLLRSTSTNIEQVEKNVKKGLNSIVTYHVNDSNHQLSEHRRLKDEDEKLGQFVSKIISDEEIKNRRRSKTSSISIPTDRNSPPVFKVKSNSLPSRLSVDKIDSEGAFFEHRNFNNLQKKKGNENLKLNTANLSKSKALRCNTD